MKLFATKKNLELFNVAYKESGVEHNISVLFCLVFFLLPHLALYWPYTISQVESNLSFNLLI